MYSSQEEFFMLVKHSYSKAIVNTLLLYLNLDQTRNATLIPERTALKIRVVN